MSRRQVLVKCYEKTFMKQSNSFGYMKCNHIFYLTHRPQQTSPAGSIGSSGNHRPPYSQHQHHYPLHGKSQQQPLPQHQTQSQYSQNSQHQQPQINRPPLPTTNSTDQNLNPQTTHLHPPHAVANSRASSSSGGNASTVQSTGGGSISGQTGPSPNAAKQEQRLTHEQVCTKCFFFRSNIT